MFDLLAAIQEIEPTAIPLVAIMLSSVAMYLVGIILPCSPCCTCTLCTEGALPETLTVTFDNESHGNGLHTTSGKSSTDFGPEKW